MKFFHRYIAVIFTNQIFSSLNLSVNINGNIFIVYTEGIAMGIFTHNKSVGILQRVKNKLMHISLQLTDKIIYGYPVGDMLNNTKKFIDGLKQVINFFIHIIYL